VKKKWVTFLVAPLFVAGVSFTSCDDDDTNAYQGGTTGTTGGTTTGG